MVGENEAESGREWGGRCSKSHIRQDLVEWLGVGFNLGSIGKPLKSLSRGIKGLDLHL